MEHRLLLPVLLTGLVLISLPCWTMAQLVEDSLGDIECEVGFFNENCTGVCHCLNIQMCDPNEGYCLDNVCDRGWQGAPECQTPCPEDFFGTDCRFECHCNNGVVCDHINGLCDDLVCHPDWSGAGCQIRLPRLTTEPTVANISCREFNVSWPKWNSNFDTGDPPVGKYVLEVRYNFTDPWIEYYSQGDRNISRYAVYFTDKDPYSQYEFRIVVYRIANRKFTRGHPSPNSEPFQPECIVPTTTLEPTTTIPTTTTVTIPTTTPTTTVPTVPTTTTVTIPTTTSTTTSTTTTTTATPTTSRDPLVSTTVTDEPPTTTEQGVTTSQAPETTTLMTTTVMVETTTPKPAPGTVGDLTVIVDPESTRVLIRWDPPTNVDDIVFYNVTYQKVGYGDCDTSREEPVPRLSPGDRTEEVLDLSSWTHYELYVSAVNDVGRGPVEMRTFTTGETIPTTRPQNVQLTEEGPDSVVITWEFPSCYGRNGILTGFNVEWTEQGTSESNSMKTNSTTYRISRLKPFSTYLITVSYVNGAGSGPKTETLVTKTLQFIPAAPRNLKAENETDTTIYITWDPPSVPNGVLTQYKVVYTRVDDPNKEISTTTEHKDSGNGAWIQGLEAWTEYTIRVQARTESDVNEGWGNYTAPLTKRTGEGYPSAPLQLARNERTANCLGIRWSPPNDPKGAIAAYKITYKVIVVQSMSQADPSSMDAEVSGDTTTFRLCDVVPAAQYRFRVAASTSKGFGVETSVDIWSEVGVPDIPPRPVVGVVTKDTITITIQPVALTGGPLSAYFIVVETTDEPASGSNRRRRALPDPVIHIPLTGYTTAQLNQSEVRTSTEFVVGNDKNYGTYTNAPLTKGQHYNIHYVVASSLDGVTKMSASRTAEPTQTQSGIDTNILIMAIVIPLGILILIALIILIWWLCRDKCQKTPDEDREGWIDYMTKQFNGTVKSQNNLKWTNISGLNENRRPIYDPDHAPEDIAVSDIHHGRPKISFAQEYKNLTEGQPLPHNIAEKPINRERNRFDHLLAYDHSRVVLRGNAESDYINANYINGYSKQKEFISAQSPFNDVTMCDFWYMVYQESVCQIVFMAQLVEDGIVKSEQYWPHNGAQQYGDILVRYHDTETYAHYIIRSFDIMSVKTNKTKRVIQYQFTHWPEHGVPDDPIPFLEFRMKVRTSMTTGDGPIVLHCGTGVSRSAVFIAVDSLMEQAKLENCVNVFKFCKKMRRNRPMMVRTEKQYKFIYDALFEALITNYNIVGEDLKVNYRQLSRTNPVTDKSYFREQFEVLEQFAPPVPIEKSHFGIMEENKKKNRFGTIVPPDKYRPHLQTPGGRDRNDYINALFLDSHLEKNFFICTQTPLRETVIDFWKLVYDYNSPCIIHMNGGNFREETCATYWPSRQGMEKYEPFFVSQVDEFEDEHVTIRTLKLTNSAKPSEEPRTVKQFHFQAWKMYDKVPWSREGMIQLIELVDDWLDEVGVADVPIIVHCMDGASQSGLFCASYIVCEKIRWEEEVDIFHTIKHMKIRRKHFINSLEQYKFCFKILWDYMNTRVLEKVKVDETTGHHVATPRGSILRSKSPRTRADADEVSSLYSQILKDTGVA